MIWELTSRFRVALALLLLLSMLAACGGDDDEEPTTTATGAAGGAASPTTQAATASPTTASEASPTSAGGGTTASPATNPDDDEEVTLRVGVSMTPPETLESFQAGIDAILERHPKWTIEVEQTPQEGIVEKMNSQIAATDLPDVVQLQGLMAQQWIRQTVFVDLTELAGDDAFNVDDFWGGALDQFRWNDGLYSIPNTVAPDVLYYNKEMFDAAGVAYPTDDWTMEDLREAALQLTLDDQGRTPDDPDFDPENVVQWGFNTVPNHIWAASSFLKPFGANPCVNEDCTEVNFEDPAVIEALQWWADLAQDHGAPYDPYSGNLTGVPGDPFSAGLAAMGFNGFFLVGQLNATGAFEYDIVQPPLGPADVRSTPLSTTGWAIPTTSEKQDAAWELITELTSPEFLTEYWAKPGNAVPARKSVAESVINPEIEPANQQAIVAALEYGEVFRPFTASAFEAYAKTTELFVAMMKGDTTVVDGAKQVDDAANEVLEKDR